MYLEGNMNRKPLLFCLLILLSNFIYAKEVSLFKTDQKNYGWTFNNGPEFKGAVVNFEAKKDGEEPVIYLHGDFNGGGNYVNADCRVDNVEAEYLQMYLNTSVEKITFRVIDTGGVCHQIDYKAKKVDGWQKIKFPLKSFFENFAKGKSLPEVTRYESWGGRSKDRQFSGKVKALSFILGRHGLADNKGTLGFKGMKILEPVLRYNKNYKLAFEDEAESKDWKFTGKASFSNEKAANGKGALLLTRTVDERQNETKALSGLIPVTPGKWNAKAALHSELESQDNSYQGRIRILMYNSKGRQIDDETLGIATKPQDWFTIKKTISIPPGVTDIRFEASMEKTWGKFWIDDIDLTIVFAATSKSHRISKILLKPPVLGNLFYPGDKPYMDVEIEARATLAKTQEKVEYVVKDYWGNNLNAPQYATLNKTDRSKYETKLNLDSYKIEIGKYYEVHISIPKGSGGHWKEYAGLAILPEAPARNYDPTKIPFTIRNWDSRIPVYFDLTDRIGIRVAGVWGRFNNRAPYKPELPGLDKVQKYKMGISTGAPGADVERNGWKKQTPEDMAKGMTEWLEKFYEKDRYLQICLGNEPHGTGKTVKDNVKAYKVLYEAIKKFNKDIVVIGTSVNANEEYFKEGFHHYLDAYDFHIYETHKDVRRTLNDYRNLAIKYNALKPIVSTELGLNSQGQPRLKVASELYRKVTAFFAEGGANVSWFTIMYPDHKGKSRGDSGTAHNTFDCKYNQYNPKMDAVAYYHMVNQLLDKKFVAEKQYDDVENHIFKDKDNNCLQVIWKNSGVANVFLTMPGVNEVELTAADGTKAYLNAKGKGLNLTLSDEPYLLSYKCENPQLSESLKPAEITFEPVHVVQKGTLASVTFSGLNSDTKTDVPFGWELMKEENTLKVKIPSETTSKEGRISVQNESTYLFSRLVIKKVEEE